MSFFLTLYDFSITFNPRIESFNNYCPRIESVNYYCPRIKSVNSRIESINNYVYKLLILSILGQ